MAAAASSSSSIDEKSLEDYVIDYNKNDELSSILISKQNF